MSQKAKAKKAQNDPKSTARLKGVKRKKIEPLIPTTNAGGGREEEVSEEGPKNDLDEYRKRSELYFHEGMNQYSQLFLKKMANSKKVVQTGKHQTILKQLTKVCKLLHMNELEVAAWSLWVDELNWSPDDLSLDDFLFVTAIQAKSYLNSEEEMNVYLKKVDTDHPNVRSLYDSWTKSEAHRINLKIIDINKRYRKFRQPSVVSFSIGPANIDYNQSVEELLKMTPHDGGRGAAQAETVAKRGTRIGKKSTEAPTEPPQGPPAATVYESTPTVAPAQTTAPRTNQSAEMQAMVEEPKYMSGENLPGQQPTLQPEESEGPLMLPGLVHGDSIIRSMDYQLPLLRGDSIFSNITPEDLLQGNNQFGGLSRQPSLATRPLSAHQEEFKREEFGGSPPSQTNSNIKLELKEEPTDNK